MAADRNATGRREPRRYEFRVRGPIGPTIMEAFPTLTATRSGHDTLLTGSIPDQCALYGVIHQLEELGLELLEINRRNQREEKDAMRVVFVHGACVKDGSWWWHRTGELLAEHGVSSEAPALPSCGETGEPTGAGGPGLPDDVAAVRHVLTASDEPTVVVAHSYGGIVTAEAAAALETVRHLLLVSSYLPEVGQSLSSFGADEPAPFLEIDPERGTFTVRPDTLADTFLQDCGPEIQRQAVGKTAHQSLAVLEQPVRSAAWQQVASTYLVCAEDRGTTADRQRQFARRASNVVEIDSGHHPFLSQPAAVRDLILGL